MNSLIQFVQTHNADKATDIVLCPGKKSLFRSGFKWLASEGKLSDYDFDSIISSLSNEFNLDSQITFVSEESKSRFVRGEGFSTGGARGVHLRRHRSELPSWEEDLISHIVHDFASYPSGLSILFSPPGGGKTTTLRHIIRSGLSGIGNGPAVIDGLEGTYISQSHQNLFEASAPEFLGQTPCSFYYCDRVYEVSNIAAVVQKAVQGERVILTMNAKSIAQGLGSLMNLLKASGYEALAVQLPYVLNALSAQFLVEDRESQPLPIFEALTISPLLRQQLVKASDYERHSLIESAVLEPTAVSFNQSLLSHLLKRRIDIQTAFAVTNDPKLLNELMKKAGV